MSSIHQLISPASVRILMRSGLMFTEQGNYADARRVFAAITECYRAIPHTRVAKALCELYENRVAQATAELTNVLEQFPDCQIAKAFLGFALCTSDSRGGEGLLRAVVFDDRDPWAVNFALKVLERLAARIVDEECVAETEMHCLESTSETAVTV